MLEFEAAKGQAPALVVPDELTVTHMWKGAPREYNFDAVFSPEASQEQVLWRAAGALRSHCVMLLLVQMEWRGLLLST